MEVVLHEFRRHVQHKVECDSIEMAIGVAAMHEDAGTGAADRITTPDGKVLLGPEELNLAIAAYEEWQWEAWLARKDGR